jgi:hypothetical protein
MTPADITRMREQLATDAQEPGCSERTCMQRLHQREGMCTNGGCRCYMDLAFKARRSAGRHRTIAQSVPALLDEVERLRALLGEAREYASGVDCAAFACAYPRCMAARMLMARIDAALGNAK